MKLNLDHGLMLSSEAGLIMDSLERQSDNENNDEVDDNLPLLNVNEKEMQKSATLKSIKETSSHSKYFLAIRLENKDLLKNLKKLQDKFVTKYPGIKKHTVPLEQANVRIIQFTCDKTTLEELKINLREFIVNNPDLRELEISFKDVGMIETDTDIRAFLDYNSSFITTVSQNIGEFLEQLGVETLPNSYSEFLVLFKCNRGTLGVDRKFLGNI